MKPRLTRFVVALLSVTITPLSISAQTSWNLGGNTIGASSNDFGALDAKNVDFITGGTVRMSLTSGGKLGIGTSSPGGVLHISVNATDTKPQLQLTESEADWIRIRLNNSTTTTKYWMLNAKLDPTTESSSQFKFSYKGATGSAIDVMTIGGTGNVGINTSSQPNKLYVNGPTTSSDAPLKVYSNSPAYGGFDIPAIDAISNNGIGNGIGVYGTGGKFGVVGIGDGGTSTLTSYGVQGNAWGTLGSHIGVHGHALGNGNINYGVYGIADGVTQTNIGVYGTAYGAALSYAGYFESGDVYVKNNLMVDTTLAVSGYKLAVNGKIICEELRVELSESWPDYVFTPGYSLKSLDELEKAIAETGHLPLFPSAGEIEIQGIEVGAMQSKIVEQLENAILYIIELEHRIDALESQAVEK